MYCRALVQACFATFHLHTQLVNVVLKSFIVLLYIPYTFLNANVADTSIENTYYVSQFIVQWPFIIAQINSEHVCLL